jgi:hypothetical protein
LAITTKELIARIRNSHIDEDPDLADGKSIKKAGSKFRYRILLDNRPDPVEREKITDTLEYKVAAKKIIQTFLRAQIIKSGQKLKMKDYQISMSDGFTARQSRQYYDYSYGMKMIPADEKCIQLHREYYQKVRDKSELILDWVRKLEVEEYSRDLHRYLLQLIVLPMPAFSEKKRIQCQEQEGKESQT